MVIEEEPMMSKVHNDLDKVGHSQNAEQKKRKRKRTPHGKKADKVGNVSIQQDSDSPTMIFDSVADGFPPRKEKQAEKPEGPKYSENLEEIKEITLDAASKKQKKQKRTIESNTQTDLTLNINAVHDSPPKEKRKHKEKCETTPSLPAENSPETNVIPEKSKKPLKRKRKLSEASPEEAEAEVETTDKTESSERKKKKKYSELESADVSVETSTLKSKKKKRPKIDDFPNPSGNSNLSEAALKALEYVHANVASTPDWKFSKARQNWIIRNLWDDVIVPDLYFPSCLEYLSGVQGNTRNVLIKSSKDILEKASTQTSPADKETLSSVKSISKVRFQDDDELKGAKGLEGTVSRDTVAATTDTKGDGTSDGLISPGKLERARRLLERLEVRTT